MAQNGKALEINTSGLFLALNETLPPESIVKRFKELGGEYITIGSDSHYHNKLGAGIEEGMALAKKCGFEYAAIYQKREPVMLPIK